MNYEEVLRAHATTFGSVCVSVATRDTNQNTRVVIPKVKLEAIRFLESISSSVRCFGSFCTIPELPMDSRAYYEFWAGFSTDGLYQPVFFLENRHQLMDWVKENAGDPIVRSDLDSLTDQVSVKRSLALAGGNPDGAAVIFGGSFGLEDMAFFVSLDAIDSFAVHLLENCKQSDRFKKYISGRFEI